MADYVVYKCAFTSSNSVWVEKLCVNDSFHSYTSSQGAIDKVAALDGAETGSPARTYKWEYISGHA